MPAPAIEIRLGIAIPTINRADLLAENVASLLAQADEFDKLVVIDNGDQDLSFDDGKIELIRPGRNLGVAASWNLGVARLFEDTAISITHVLVLNDDIALRPGQLAAIRETIASEPEGWFFVGPYYWSVWAISRAGAEVVTAADGYLFDEAIFPAYFEDNDFYHRFTSRFPDRYIADLTSFEPDVQRNSASCARDPALNARFATNRDYYICKWGGPPGEERRTPEVPLSIDFCYETFCARPSDIYEHLPALRELAEKCDHITELGVRTVVSTWAFLMARPGRLTCYDLLEHPNISVAARLAAGEGIDFEFFDRDVLKVEIEETDLLFIDTLHTYAQLLGELVRHSKSARKSIVMHDTVSYGHRDEVDDGVVIAKRGLVPAIVDFLNSADGSGWEHYGTDIGNNGLTVLVRKGGTFDPGLD